MKTETTPVTVNILNKEYRIACPLHEKEALLSSASYLNDKMKEVRVAGKIIGIDRVSVMAALNIVHELIQFKTNKGGSEVSTNPRLIAIQHKIDAFLAKSEQLRL